MVRQPDYARMDVVNGQRVVSYAPNLIEIDVSVTNYILTAAGGEPIEEAPDGRVVLDSAGEIIYQRIERNRRDLTRNIGVYRRVHTSG